MTNLNHYSVHYTMHMVMENRNGRNPGKHFFLLLFANTNSVPHGLLCTALLGKKKHYPIGVNCVSCVPIYGMLSVECCVQVCR